MSSEPFNPLHVLLPIILRPRISLISPDLNSVVVWENYLTLRLQKIKTVKKIGRWKSKTKLKYLKIKK